MIGPDASRLQLFNGRPSKFHSAKNQQVTFSREELEKMLGQPVGRANNAPDAKGHARHHSGQAAQPVEAVEGIMCDNLEQFLTRR